MSAINNESYGLCIVCGAVSDLHCGACRVFYCCEQCQKEDWPIHQFICSTINTSMAESISYSEAPPVEGNEGESTNNHSSSSPENPPLEIPPLEIPPLEIPPLEIPPQNVNPIRVRLFAHINNFGRGQTEPHQQRRPG